MLTEIVVEIEQRNAQKSALIVDAEQDFCDLLKFYLSKKEFTVSIAHNLPDGLKLLKGERPSLLVVNVDIHSIARARLEDEIKTMADYSPTIYFFGAKQQNEGAVMYTLKRGDDDDVISYVKKMFDEFKNMFK